MSAPPMLGNTVGTGSIVVAGTLFDKWKRESTAEPYGKLAQERHAGKHEFSVQYSYSFRLVAVLVGEILGQIRLQLPVIGMDGGTQSGFSRISLANALQNSLDIAHPIRVCDERDGSQRFGVCKIGLRPGELQKATFQRIERDALLRFKQQRELMPVTAETFWLEILCDALMQPGRATSC